MAEVTILGLGNLLWADEGFGVRAAEKLFEQYADNEKVDVVDGGTQGLALLPWLQQTEKLLIMDAIDFGMAPGSLAMFRDEQVPAYLTAKKLSLHQTSFSEVLALLQLTGGQLSEIVLIGVQPECLDDYGGSLTPQVKAQLMPAVCLAQEVLAQWGMRPCPLKDSIITACVWNATKMNGQMRKALAGSAIFGCYRERNHNVYRRSCAGYFTRSVVRQMPRPTRRAYRR